MTRKEAVKILRENKEANGKKESLYSVFDWIKAHDMAIRSLEAWDKVKKDLADMWLEGYSPHTEVMEIINRHLKEVEE